MKLLLIKPFYSRKHLATYDYLAYNVLSLDKSFELILYEKIEINNKLKRKGLSNILEKENPDIIIAFSKHDLNIVNKTKLIKNIPVLYSLFYSELVNEYMVNWNLLDRFLVIEDFINRPTSIFHKSIVNTFKFKFNLFPFKEYEVNLNKINVFISIEEDYLFISTLFQLLPAINLLTNIHFTIRCKFRKLANFLNHNVDLIEIKDDDEIEYVKLSDLVIGSGNIVHEAINHCKLILIIGKRGWGGLVTGENIKMQHFNGYQGRIGGELGEYIPTKLIVDEINECLLMSKEDRFQITKENYEFICKEFNESIIFLKIFLNEIIDIKKSINNNLENLKLKWSGLFELVSDGKGQNAIVHSFTNQIHSIVEREELNVLTFFRYGALVSDISNRITNPLDRMKFLDFVKELLNEKILINYD